MNLNGNKKLAELIVGCYQGDWFPVKDFLLEDGQDVPDHLNEIPFDWFDQACVLLYENKVKYWNSLTLKNFLNKLPNITEKQYIWLKYTRTWPKVKLDFELKMLALHYHISKRDSVFDHCYGPFGRRKQDVLKYLYDLEMVLRFFKLKHRYKDIKKSISAAKWL